MKGDRGLFIIILVFLIMFVYAEGEDKIDPKVIEKLEQNESVRVIVEVNDQGNIFSLDSEENIDKVIDEVGEEKVDNKHTFDNTFSAELTKEEILDLENNRRVDKIIYDQPVRAFLQDSVVIINSSRILPRILINNLTGIGQSVCIIDTGINYSNPDLGGCYGNNNFSSNCKVVGGYDFVNSDSDPIDDEGHGTHIAGIISANGNITGIAPGAKIIALKALDSSGGGYTSDIISAIEWCVSNSSVFNITVISMSLGDNLNYTGYCNDNSMTPSINAAVAKNISVVIATGNNGNVSAVSSPACVQNATRVSSVTKTDEISSFSSRSSIVRLFAPGNNINSTYLTGYTIFSGTSMAAPHVSGAILLMNNYLNDVRLTKTPLEIENTLNSTGKLINDSLTGIIYSRINIYDAILSFDTIDPNVSLVGPINDSYLLNNSLSFYCNASDFSLRNVTFYLWNSSSIYNTTIKNASGSLDIFEVNLTNVAIEEYHWNCLYYDEQNNSAFAKSNNTFRLNYPNVSLISPVNLNYTNQISEFVCNYTSLSNLTNSTLYIWNSSSTIFYNTTVNLSGNFNNTNLSYNISQEGLYYWNCFAGNVNGKVRYSENNYSIYYDLNKPMINLSSPEEGYSVTGTTDFVFSYNVSENINISKCNLIINSELGESNSTLINMTGTNSISRSISAGSYSWSINCTDKAGNIGNSTIRNFTVNSVSSSGGGGGGGGGGSSASSITNQPVQYDISSKAISDGYSKELKKDDQINFKIKSSDKEVEHTIKVNNIDNTFVNLTIRSDPINLLLYVGQEVKINISSDKVYDLYLKAEKINNGKVNISVKNINEPIINGIVTENTDFYDNISSNNSELKQEKDESVKSSPIFLVIFLTIFICMVFVFYRIKVKRMRAISAFFSNKYHS